MKKIISLLLVLATVMSCFVLTVSAAPTGEFTTDEGMLPFEDVKDSHWFTPYIKFCYANGIIKGMTEYTVVPNGTLTRAQFVTMLANLEGVDTTTYTVTAFTDVKSNHWYYGAVAWAYTEGVVSGMSETTFAPNAVLNRAQLATVMKNYMSKNEYAVEINNSVLDNFSDKPKTSYWFYDSMVYAVSAGLLSGNSNGTLAATGNVTRAQAAVIFEAFINKYFYGDCEHEFSTPDCTNPASCSKCGLVNGLPNGHRVTGYNCVDTLKCNVCNDEVAPSKIMHNFASATCTAPRTCTICGAVRGEAKGHEWSDATCTVPKTCSVCNATEGSALGHTTTTGTCSRCGKVFGAAEYDKIVSLIKTNGRYNSEGNSHVLITEGSNSATGIAYYLSDKYLTIEYIHQFSNGHSELVYIMIDKSGSVFDYGYYYANTTEYLFAGYGMLDAATFTKSTKEGFSYYEGTLKSVYTDYMNAALKQMLNDSNKLLSPYGYSVKQLGFKVY